MSAFEPPATTWCPECGRERISCAHLEDPLVTDGGTEPKISVSAVKAYFRDLEGHVDDLYERAEGTQTQGHVLFARDRLRQAIAELEEIEEDRLDA